LLSSGGGGDVDRLAVHDHHAFVGFERKRRVNLDGFYGCDMIGLVHFCIPKPSSCCWAVSLFICRASHPGESSLWKTKTGVGMGSPCTTPVRLVWGYVVIGSNSDCLLCGFQGKIYRRYTHENHEVCRFRRWACLGCLNLFLLVPIS